MYEIYVFS